ncbi:MAG: hypothetical protein L3J03_04435 [Desulfobacterales bacterium]|nr:hypothetical protein [Desulfobacterales bacterium]
MTDLRKRMMGDMQLHGYAERTRQSYADAVSGLASKGQGDTLYSPCQEKKYFLLNQYIESNLVLGSHLSLVLLRKDLIQVGKSLTCGELRT